MNKLYGVAAILLLVGIMAIGCGDAANVIVAFSAITTAGIVTAIAERAR